MKLIAIYSASHAPLTDRYFLPTAPKDLEPIAILQEHQSDGNYGTNAFWSFMEHKVAMIRDAVRDNPGQPILYADVDIVFLAPIREELIRLLDESGKDILFQREGYMTPDVNFGFFVIRSNERSLAFFEELAARLPDHGFDDQKTANLLLPNSAPLRWDYLPWTYAAGSHGFPPPDDAVIYHANDTSGAQGIQQKIERFEDLRLIQKYGAPAKLWWKIKQKLRRTFGRK